jgi:hypothetical protein
MNDALRSRLRRVVNVLAGLIGERNSQVLRGIEDARAFLHHELAAIGVAAIEQRFPTSSREGANIEVVFAGTDASRPTLMIGAHYDSAPGTPGADDNASAVAILLEVVRGLAERGAQGASHRHTVRCIFYDCEEPPHFLLDEMGSACHAAACRQRGDRLLGMICLESLGYFVKRPQPSPYARPWMNRVARILGGRNIVLASTGGSLTFGWRVLAAMWRSGWFPIIPIAAPRRLNVINLSDHRSYWDEGYPAVMLTNTALLRNPNYHEASDLPETLDYERMSRLARVIVGASLRLSR